MENQEKVLVTQAGYEELKEELRKLVHEERNIVIQELQEARAQGDLSENADYDAARDHQARVEARIAELENMLSNIEIIEDKKTTKKTVSLGSTVEILDLDSNEKEVYTIVGSVEADPFNGKLSNVTPLAVALLDTKVGSTVTVTNVDKPYKVKVLGLK
ncbi:transcription elongation factor GreA [Breznakia sp. PF5-3]|uniref:transcription elongation factor GreA n=1 Tax=unclassified Breznakia TaxID=2623764 RepID=UPI0024052879|nr:MULTISPECIES: transcription elongation factor GreA [unclassified Breznakia]MDF9825326.1 transcription elongation factor GreA [Breznakia sp. PM6-1]MDF9836181.1 transcription elongation factor GreA [Breznakia sp. PF5-3]MDF9838421.1 transcription elongation factor GreA [Breznakia sp. PFB2-8]MDF9860437.1 transcription elongation factor GreA [Breznakia sp. PH5-24]